MSGCEVIVPAPSSSAFDLKAFLATVSQGRSAASVAKDAVIYRQEEPADAVYFLQEGRIKISVVSKQGKEAVIAILQSGAFFGEGCLIGHKLRSASAVAMVASQVTRISKAEMQRLMRQEPAFGELFIGHLLARNSRAEEDLTDQLFNSSEKRLARALLLLANAGEGDGPRLIALKVSHETLAELIGTTRPRVSHFMAKFRKLGVISYDGGLRIHGALRSLVLRDMSRIEEPAVARAAAFRSGIGAHPDLAVAGPGPRSSPMPDQATGCRLTAAWGKNPCRAS